MIFASVIAGIVAAAYGELVLDIRTPRALLTETHAIHSYVAIQLSDLVNADKAMKKKYGPEAETELTTQPPRLTTRIGGKVVEQQRTGQFSEAMGIFVIRPLVGGLDSVFPFQINPRKAPMPGRKGTSTARDLQRQFGSLPIKPYDLIRENKEFPFKYLEFDDRDAATDRCITISSADVGWMGRQLQFQSGTFCVIFWKGTLRGSMLIGVALANGDPWMRPFIRRICRELTATVLARVAATDGEPPPDYAACILVDRPDRTVSTEALQVHVYEVGRDATLAYVN